MSKLNPPIFCALVWSCLVRVEVVGAYPECSALLVAALVAGRSSASLGLSIPQRIVDSVVRFSCAGTNNLSLAYTARSREVLHGGQQTFQFRGLIHGRLKRGLSI